MDFIIAASVAVVFTAAFVVAPIVFLRWYKPFASPRHAFISGIVLTLILVFVMWSWLSLGGVGGQIEDSRDGRWTVHISAPLGPTKGGSYNIEMRDNKKTKTIRKIHVMLNSNEETVPLRGSARVITWSPTNTYADISLSKVAEIRVFVP